MAARLMTFHPPPAMPTPPASRDVLIPDAIDARPAVVRLRVHLDIDRRPVEVTLADSGGHAPARIAHWLSACHVITATLSYDTRARVETTCRMEAWGDSVLAAVARAARG